MEILFKHSCVNNSARVFNINKMIAIIMALTFCMPAISFAEESSGMVNFAKFANKWLNCDCAWPNWCDGADINTDGRVDTNDLLALPENWTVPIAGDVITWVSIDESNFSGRMSKYLTTNGQYAAYLNSAFTNGLIVVHANGSVYLATDINHLQAYTSVYPSDTSSQITFSSALFSVRTRDGYNMGDHPVASVTLYGAMAFCDYYGFRLPTNSEWMAVADYDGSFAYGCGINSVMPNAQMANYGKSNPLNLSSEPFTTPVNYYYSYGYGLNDMTGNVYEWTTTTEGYDCYGNPLYIAKGGDWTKSHYAATVGSSSATCASIKCNGTGFRVCR